MRREENEMCEDDKKKSIKKFRQLLSANGKLNIFQEHDDNYLQRFLYSTEFVVENAFTKMETFYDVLGKHCNWFTVKRPTEKKYIIEQSIAILTNIHDKEGRPVYIVKLGNINTNTMALVDDVVAVFDFFIELLLISDPKYKNGLCVIVDISHFHLNILKWLTPANIKTSLSRILSMPIKEYKFHVVNSSRIINTAVNIIWPFLPKNIKDGVIFHFEDWDGLHKHIDKQLLPTEYHGDNDINYIKLREQLYERDEEITNNFRLTRQIYLNHIKKDVKM